ncbi:hypothetical protein BGZ70_009105, partial [Mortierella alpina]
MEDGVIIDITGESTGRRSRDHDITEEHVQILGVSSSQQNSDYLPRTNEDKEEEQDGVLPSPQPVYRSYFEVLDDNDQPAHELVLQPVKEIRPPITLTSAAKYLKLTIPALTPPVKRTHFDVVLGISTGDLKLKAVEAIIITIQHKAGDDSTARSEVIIPQKLEKLCSVGVLNDADRVSTLGDEGSKSCRITTMAPDDTCFRWKLHEKLIGLGDDPVQLVLELKTWQGESTDYGSIKLQYTEILTDSQAFYAQGKRTDFMTCDWSHRMYREHRPYIDTIDVNRTGCSQLDANPEGPKRITECIISGDSENALVTTVAGDHRFLQLWNICQSQLVAWMQLPVANSTAYDYCLSWEGTKLVCIDLGDPDGGSDKKGEKVKEETQMEAPKQNATAFYDVDIEYTEVPAGMIAGSGFQRSNDEKLRHTLKGISAKAAFHKVDHSKEEFVTCDGVTIEVYEPRNLWKLRLSIVMDPTRDAPKLATNVSDALRNNLRGSYLVIRDGGAHQVSTWDIKRGIRLSSYTNLTYEQMENINHCAAVSNDGSRIAIPDKHQVDIFLTATWTLVAHYSFRGMEHNPSTRAVHFICNERIMVALDYKHLPFYQRNRGFILDANRVFLVEEYIAEGRDTFCVPTDPWVKSSAFCIGVSQLSFFKLEDRTVLSPTRLKWRCGEFCRSTESFQDQELAAATAPSGLRLEAGRSTAPVVIHGRQEYLPVLIVTASDKNGHPIERLSISLPKSLWCNSATFVNGCSHLLISFNNLVMVWRTPASFQDTFTLQLVLAVNRPTKWKVCPHRQLYGLRTQEQLVTDGTNLDGPVYDVWNEFVGGIALLPRIFGNANNVVQQQIILYIGNNMNKSHTGVDGLGTVCLQELADPRKPYSEATLKLLRDLAYLPARDREAIMSQHWIAHPFELHWRFWSPNLGGLDQYKDQVLKVTSAHTVNSPENSFSREIYLATFDMLWLRSSTLTYRNYRTKKLSYELGSRILFLPVVMMMRRLNIAFNWKVECHPFELAALDNPAIAALVEYKWNTIGLQYWLLRFLAQCVYYALVIVGVFMQIYSYNGEPTMKSIFTAIVAMAAFFLWLELMQIIKYRYDYFQSVYNYVDLLAFLTPFVAIILQLISSDFDAQNSLMSFSVLFIFLHFSGRYDSVSTGLSNDDVGIHIMLMMFFFFTVIVMMNVLIALINHAFDDGDKTWERDWLQNRMRYVESAENLAIDISASALQVREYKKKTEKLKEANSPTVDVTVKACAESQTLVSEIFGGNCQDWLQSQQQKREEVDANTGENSAMMKMSLFQDQRRPKEQKEAWSEQQEVNKALLTAVEELRHLPLCLATLIVATRPVRPEDTLQSRNLNSKLAHLYILLAAEGIQQIGPT